MKAFNKSILILFISLIIVSLAMTTVSAEEIDNDISTTSIFNYDSDVSSVSSNTGSWIDLQEKINVIPIGGVLDLDSDYSFNESTDSAEGVYINKSITINGNGHTMDGKNLSRMIYVNASNIIINDLIFINGHTTLNGGAIYSSYPNLTINNCSFVNNSIFSDNLSSGYGGAIYSYNNTSIVNCSFDNNYVASYLTYKYASYSFYGGAIYGNNNLSVVNCSFDNNYVSSQHGNWNGGAIYIINNPYIINCSFINNSASRGRGGAIHIKYNMDNFPIANCSFINNSAGIGGAIHVSGGRIFSIPIINCSFINNSGSAVHVFIRNLTINNCSFIDNRGSSGGAIHSEGTDVSNSIFINNSAGNGGAIYNTISNLTVVNSTFINNSAENGGDIESHQEVESSYDAHIFLINSSFTNSYASEMGGCVCTESGVSALNSTFFNNSANMGGSFCLDRSGRFRDFIFIDNSTFINNNASQGGVLMSRNSYLSDALVNNSKFINNSATSSGGTIYMNTPIDVEFSTFINNSAKSGGALYLSRKSVVAYSIFDNNSATTGRDIYASSVVNSFFNNNYWSMNFTSVDEFINANLIANRTSAIVPDNWVLMNIYVNPELEVGTNSSVAVKFDKVTDGSTISDFDGVLPDYSTNIYMLTMKEDEEYNHKWNDENHNISRIMDTLVLHENEAKYDFVVDAPGMYSFYTHSPFTVWEESVKVGVAVLQPNMTVQVITLDPQVYVGNTTSFEVVVKNNGEWGLSSICIDESSFDDLVLDSWSSDDAWIYSFEDGVHKWTLDDVLDVNETTSFVLVFNTTAVGNKTISVVGSSVNDNISDKVADNVTEVIKINTIVTVDPVKGEVGDKVNITAKVTDQEGNPVPNGTVIIEFNGKEYEVSVVDGVAIVEVVLPSAGNYSATAYYKESDYYYGSSTVFTVEVIKVPGPNPNPDPNPKPTPINNGNMENTGNPLLVLLIALGMIGIESLRRKF